MPCGVHVSGCAGPRAASQGVAAAVVGALQRMQAALGTLRGEAEAEAEGGAPPASSASPSPSLLAAQLRASLRLGPLAAAALGPAPLLRQMAGAAGAVEAGEAEAGEGGAEEPGPSSEAAGSGLSGAREGSAGTASMQGPGPYSCSPALRMCTRI